MSQLLLFSHYIQSDSFCDPMVCSPPGSSILGISQARILRVGCHFLLQGIPEKVTFRQSPEDWLELASQRELYV